MKIELIDYPYKITEDSNIQLVKHDDIYYSTLLNDIYSKKLVYKDLNTKKKIFICKIEKNNNLISLKKVDKYYEMSEPVDFITQYSKSNYDEIINSMFAQDENHLITLTKALANNKKQGEHFFNKYSLNLLNRYKTYSTYNFRSFKYENSELNKYYHKYGDPIPFEGDGEQLNILKSRYPEHHKYILNRLKEIVNKHKIIGANKILTLFFKDNTVETLTPFTIKPFIKIVAYYSITGPWRNRWIKLGYDPSKDVEAYREQIIPLRKIKGQRRICDEYSFIKRIESNRKLYLNNTCEYEKGFLSKEAISIFFNLFENRLIEKNTATIEGKDEDIVFDLPSD